MRSTLSIICLLALVVSFVMAAPTPIQKRSFKVERVRNANFQGYNGAAQRMKALRKFRVHPPQDLIDALAAQRGGAGSKDKGHRQKGTATATATGAKATSGSSGVLVGSDATNTSSSNVGIVTNTPTTDDTEFLSPVTIGGQTLNLDFDTGSSDLWVFNTQLSAQESDGQTLFDPTKSSTFSSVKGATFLVSYGDGSEVAGNVGTDTVNVGGATVTKQAIELATAVSASFISDTSSDGLMGLAFSVLNQVKPTQQKTFFDNVKADLAEPLFAADLRHNAAGSYEFGAIDSSKFSGALSNVAINTTQGFWQFSSASFAVGDGKTQTMAASQAIADTGTTLMLVNAAVIDGYFANVTGAEYNQQAGGVTIPCDANLPDLKIDVGGATATVSGSNFIFENIGSNTCFSGLQPIDSDLMIFGDVFFKSNYVVFNGNNTLSFAPHA
ncbi:extracellular aspartic proteinase [Grosmannia clavigera kw1407]|uniref:Extracellular aspartic proteinase n=1 Tax=Grosmannia clavigera (strain kw1407 / UAMH 11150) TaxID=655863 RepID=F0XT61_GROCL|nr:extracellular aspartic proteinase [Grosmannia clavigera kw1407]EFW99274.1 extracellular aspartic proteinase [Grosmannia clavigera kw1407]